MFSRLSLFLFLLAPAFAEEPNIEARRFEIKPLQKSTSGKIYLFESGVVIPKTGNLILVYDHEKPVMAFRVLKNESEKFQFIGKRVRRYDSAEALEINKSYLTIEKTGDVIPPPPKLATLPEDTPPEQPVTDEVKENMDPLAEPGPSPTPTPAEPTTPPEAKDPELDEEEVKKLDQIDLENPTDEAEQANEFEYDDHIRIEPFDNMLSISAGFYGNSSNFNTTPYYSNGFGLSFSRSFFHEIFFSNQSPQDSVSVEVGFAQYSISNKDQVNDSYSLLPFYGNLIYQIHMNQTFTLFGYGGLQFNYMTSVSNPGDSLELLQGFQPNFGIGVLYSMGPQWYFRADIGWDKITGGLSLKW